MRGGTAAIIAASLFIVACSDQKPEHYYVMCTDTSDGWKLVDSRKDENGYLIACTFQSPDKSQVRTDVCTSTGCD